MRRAIAALAALLTTTSAAYAQGPQFLQLDRRTLIGRKCYCGETTRVSGYHQAPEGFMNIVALNCDAGFLMSRRAAAADVPFESTVGSTACYRWLLVAAKGGKLKRVKVERLGAFVP